MTAPPTRAGVDDRTVVSYVAPIALFLPAVPIMAGADTAGGRAAVRGSSRPVDCEEDGQGKKEVRERRGRVRGGARHGAGRARHARAPTSRSDRWGIEWMGWRTLRALVLPMVCEGLNAVALGGLVFR